MLIRVSIVVSAIIALSPMPQSGGPARKAATAARRPRQAAPPRQYEARAVEGWTVLINKELSGRRPELADAALKELSSQLYRITRVVPRAALQDLRTIKIWVEEREAEPPCMTYHPDPGWLREHGKDPAKARCVELANIRNFLDWTIEQPWMLLHELSHGYHHQFLDGGFENRDIRATYERAMQAKLYDSVLRANGRTDRGYAATNHKEYFAEISEAFFGSNDFFPFVRAELKEHDSRGFELVRRIWGLPDGGRRASVRRAPRAPRRQPGARDGGSTAT
jgi:hypothetical protein